MVCGGLLPLIFEKIVAFFLPLPLTKFLMALAHSDIADIALSTCVIVGRVMLLWLKCTLSVNLSLLVVFMCHQCVR